jgi:hypothetical protein
MSQIKMLWPILCCSGTAVGNEVLVITRQILLVIIIAVAGTKGAALCLLLEVEDVVEGEIVFVPVDVVAVVQL